MEDEPINQNQPNWLWHHCTVTPSHCCCVNSSMTDELIHSIADSRTRIHCAKIILSDSFGKDRSCLVLSTVRSWQDNWKLGPRTFETMGLWNCGTLGLHHFWTMGLSDHRTFGLWDIGTMGLGEHWTLKPWDFDCKWPRLITVDPIDHLWAH